MMPTGTNLNYVSAAGGGHVPLPDPERRVRIEQGRVRRVSIDWDKTRPPAPAGASAPPSRCRWCRNTAAGLVDELCQDCRTAAEERFTAPRTLPDAPTPAPAPADPPETPQEPQSAPEPPEAASAASGSGHLDRLLATTEGDTRPVVQALRATVLSALDALEHLTDPSPAPAPRRRQAAPTRRRSSRVDEAEIVRRYTEDRTTVGQIAADLGHGKQTVRNVLLAANVTLRDDRTTNSGGRNHIQAYPDELVAAIRTRYVDHQMTQGQVAADLDISVKLVQNVMARHNIPPRPSAAAASRAGQGRDIKLNDTAVTEICDRYEAGESAGALSRAYGVSIPTVLDRLRSRGVQVRTKAEAARLRVARTQGAVQ